MVPTLPLDLYLWSICQHILILKLATQPYLKAIYSPQVNEEQIQRDLSMKKFDWDLCGNNLDFQKIYDNMQKSAYVFFILWF